MADPNSPTCRLIVVPVVALAVSVTGLAGCYYKSRLPPGTCENEQLSEMASPDKQWKSVLFERYCGDERPEMDISVLPATATLPNEPGNAFRQELIEERGHSSFRMQQMWNGPLELSIRHDRSTKVAFSATEVGPVRVIHSVVENP